MLPPAAACSQVTVPAVATEAAGHANCLGTAPDLSLGLQASKAHARRVITITPSRALAAWNAMLPAFAITLEGVSYAPSDAFAGHSQVGSSVTDRSSKAVHVPAHSTHFVYRGDATAPEAASSEALGGQVFVLPCCQAAVVRAQLRFLEYVHAFLLVHGGDAVLLAILLQLLRLLTMKASLWGENFARRLCASPTQSTDVRPPLDSAAQTTAGASAQLDTAQLLGGDSVHPADVRLASWQWMCVHGLLTGAGACGVLMLALLVAQTPHALPDVGTPLLLALLATGWTAITRQTTQLSLRVGCALAAALASRRAHAADADKRDSSLAEDSSTSASVAQGAVIGAAAVKSSTSASVAQEAVSGAAAVNCAQNTRGGVGATGWRRWLPLCSLLFLQLPAQHMHIFLGLGMSYGLCWGCTVLGLATSGSGQYGSGRSPQLQVRTSASGCHCAETCRKSASIDPYFSEVSLRYL